MKRPFTALEEANGPHHGCWMLNVECWMFGVVSHHSFFNFGPFGVSSIAQPFAFNSSRIASARLKSFAFFAVVRASANATISRGISVSPFVPTPRTESILSQAESAVAASAGVIEFSAMRLFVSRTQSNTAAQAAEIFK